MNYDLIIVGAGAAGLMAAFQLASSGKKILVIEAKSHVGGRAYTIMPADCNYYIETGAEFVHGKLPISLSLLQEAGIEYTEMQGRSYTIQNGKLLQDESFGMDWERLMQKLHGLNADMSLLQFLDTHFANEEDAAIRKNILQFAQGFDAADPARVSMLSLRAEWSQDNEDNQFRIAGGYSNLLNWMKDKAAGNGVRFQLQEAVTSINYSGEYIRVTTSNNTYETRKVLITISLGLWQQKHIRFSPALQEKENAAGAMGFGNVMKVQVLCKEPFWESHYKRPMPGAAFIFSDAEIPTWWTQNPAQTPVLTGWLAGPPADAMNTLSENEINGKVIRSLSYIFGTGTKELQELINGIVINNWHHEAYTLGGYSYETVDTKNARKILAAPIDNRLFFAGEALYEGAHTGTVEAAFVSAQNAIKQIEW